MPEGARAVFGTYEQLVDGTVETVYATPSPLSFSSSSSSSVKGIALLLHACTHSALKFFSPSERCPTCVGLSEELRITRILLEQKHYAVLALTSSNRKSGCWNTNTDISRVRDALSEFQSRHLQSTNQPHLSRNNNVIAIGASSGGYFAAQVARHGIANAAIAMVSAIGNFESREDNKHRLTIPPIYLAPMPRDKTTTKRATDQYRDIKTKFPKAPVVLDDTTCIPLPVTAAYLTDRVPHLTTTMARQIVRVLQDANQLKLDYYFATDPTQSNWRDVLKRECGDACLKDQELGPGISPLAKALHRAWAFHEYCSEVIVKALAFFETVPSLD